MINCRKCSFEVKPGMRHALTNNCCPACGGSLFSGVYLKRLELFKEKILQQKFSVGMSSDQVFDMSMFIMSEFFPEEKGADAQAASSEAQEEDFEKIREEVRMEKASDLGEDLDVDLKVARLKRIAKESPIKNRGPAVRRLSGD